MKDIADKLTKSGLIDLEDMIDNIDKTGLNEEIKSSLKDEFEKQLKNKKYDA